MLPDGSKVSEDEIILIYVPSFFDQLGDLLKGTSKRYVNDQKLSKKILKINCLSEQSQITSCGV